MKAGDMTVDQIIAIAKEAGPMIKEIKRRGEGDQEKEKEIVKMICDRLPDMVLVFGALAMVQRAERQLWKDRIDKMSDEEKAGLFFKAKKNHPIFEDSELTKYFMER